MLDSESHTAIPDALVFTTTDRGHSPEEMAEMAMNKIMVVSNDAPPVIRDQAIAHRDKLKEGFCRTHGIPFPTLGPRTWGNCPRHAHHSSHGLPSCR